jgi:hypothetical protein
VLVEGHAQLVVAVGVRDKDSSGFPPPVCRDSHDTVIAHSTADRVTMRSVLIPRDVNVSVIARLGSLVSCQETKQFTPEQKRRLYAFRR